MSVPILSNFLTIAEQVGVVFVIALLGYVGGKTGLFGDETSNGMASIAVNYVTPALVIMAFQREFEMQLIYGFLISLAGCLFGLALGILLSHTLIRKEPQERRSVLRGTTIFGNVGMISLPLMQALFGSDGVFYCAAGIAVFNLTFWSYCAIAMGEKGEWKATLRRALLNPCLICTLIGLTFFVCSVKIPEIPAKAMNQLVNLNMPMCMLIIGQRLSKIPMRTLFTEKCIWKTAFLRMILIPAIMIAGLALLNIRGVIAICILLMVSAPGAATVNMLAIAYKQDVDLAAKSVSMHTLLSMIVLPVVIAVAYSFLM